MPRTTPSTPVIQQWQDPNQVNWSLVTPLDDAEIKENVNTVQEWTGVNTMYLWISLKAGTERARCGGKSLDPFLLPENATVLAPTKNPYIGEGKHEFKIRNGPMYLPAHLTASAESREIHEGDAACNKCRRKPNTRYPKCITAKDVNGETTLNGACVACAYGTHWQQCSFV